MNEWLYMYKSVKYIGMWLGEQHITLCDQVGQCY